MPSSMQALDVGDVQRICSGQSIPDAPIALKELIENALDACATQIEIRFVEHGKNAIEVVDNGSGIPIENHSTLVKKNHTSKIAAFEDIETVSSFGFRYVLSPFLKLAITRENSGEALSSLCHSALELTICTKTTQDSIGTLLKYDASGNLIEKSAKARGIGTSVTPLPVRCRDFHRNIKKYYSKSLKVIHTYALISLNVKFIVSNRTGTRQQIVLSTESSARRDRLEAMKISIASVFGLKFFKTLIPFQMDETSTHGRSAYGFISQIGIGAGKSDNDRQFIYINGRPVDAPKLNKAIHQVWRQFEVRQYANYVIDFQVPSQDLDLNVTPDKRTVFFRKENEMMESLQTQLLQIFEPAKRIFTVQPLTEEKRSTPNTTTPIPLKAILRSPEEVRPTSVTPNDFETEIRPRKRAKIGTIEALEKVYTSEIVTGWTLSALRETRKRYFKEVALGKVSGREKPLEEASIDALLHRVFQKQDFQSMEIIGQFNLGFIIAKYNTKDLFIIDQHASDEKFRYESLQRTTIFHHQPLVHPQSLSLSSTEEMIILDHLQVFRKNGFTFEVDAQAQSNKLRLLSLPLSKETQFGVKDLFELVSLLQEYPSNVESLRLSKVASILASRACRSSVMIGTALSKAEMTRIVHQLTGLDQPWNCPHGRPTMRHLFDITALE
uniref:Mismatch repair endonuclease pms1 putative n=1 Tax=Albugo laibachii Nc14 TaxID=890382 RepID=F0W7Z8_9STRA|nr:mismatch repair endonuclease pms1 putative [Albugo laibachii Nc14]|eukprot:CCA17251.1 mismatch repair endonuclease pms1 putative [Albugo laibachii Nc14]